jgi:hypothetical protein
MPLSEHIILACELDILWTVINQVSTEQCASLFNS